MVYWGGGTNSNSIADSRVHNKLFYQLSTFCKAFTDLMNELNVDSEDTDLEELKNNIKQALTQNIIDTFTPSQSDNVYSINDLNIKYLINTIDVNRPSGYIILGIPYDNLLLQFGTAITSYSYFPPGAIAGNYHDLCYVTLPISYTKNYIAFAIHDGNLPVSINEFGVERTLSRFTLETKCYSSGEPSTPSSMHWHLVWFTIGV